jgi:hypothetical protein
MQHARDRDAQIPDFVAECGSTGLDAVTTRALVAGARRMGERSIEAPGLATLSNALLADVETMIEAVGAGDRQAGDAATRRFDALKAGLGLGHEQLAFSDIAKVTSVPRALTENLLQPLSELCDGAFSGAEAAVRGLEAAASLSEGNGGEAADSEDALSSTARLVDIEHAADRAERAVTRIVLSGFATGVGSLVVLELARSLARASDRMALVGHVLHNQMMSGLSH